MPESLYGAHPKKLPVRFKLPSHLDLLRFQHAKVKVGSAVHSSQKKRSLLPSRGSGLLAYSGIMRTTQRVRPFVWFLLEHEGGDVWQFGVEVEVVELGGSSTATIFGARAETGRGCYHLLRLYLHNVHGWTDICLFHCLLMF